MDGERVHIGPAGHIGEFHAQVDHVAHGERFDLGNEMHRFGPSKADRGIRDLGRHAGNGGSQVHGDGIGSLGALGERDPCIDQVGVRPTVDRVSRQSEPGNIGVGGGGGGRIIEIERRGQTGDLGVVRIERHGGQGGEEKRRSAEDGVE